MTDGIVLVLLNAKDAPALLVQYALIHKVIDRASREEAGVQL